MGQYTYNQQGLAKFLLDQATRKDALLGHDLGNSDTASTGSAFYGDVYTVTHSDALHHWWTE